jgi:hypothetical protein
VRLAEDGDEDEDGDMVRGAGADSRPAVPLLAAATISLLAGRVRIVHPAPGF